jgi:hypothetical protein
VRDPQLVAIAPQVLVRALQHVVGHRPGRLDERVHRERPVGQRAHLRDLLAHLRRLGVARRQRPQAAGVRHGGDERGRRAARHRGLHDRNVEKRQ